MAQCMAYLMWKNIVLFTTVKYLTSSHFGYLFVCLSDYTFTQPSIHACLNWSSKYDFKSITLVWN